AGISRYIHVHGVDRKVVRAIKTTRLSVAKDPRLCLYPAAMEAWAANRDDLKLIVLMRRIDHVALSLHRRKPWFARTDPLLEEETVEETARRRAQAFYECLQIAAAHAVPLRILSYPEFLDRYDLVHEALVAFGGLRWDHEAGRRTWEKLVDKNKVHVK
ncbi:MAG: hypothetical protein GXP27_06295, partial [Planctomycetes bacterium]|nr:hypothetical protein [Planctomycetota bacterium]